MRIALVTDAWQPQVNGVVTTLLELVAGLSERGHEIVLIEPSGFRRFRCPGYRELELAWRPAREVGRRLEASRANVIHIATEGPLGAAARGHCIRRGLAFTTAFHTRFPNILAKALGIPPRWGYVWFRRFHAPVAAVMVPAIYSTADVFVLPSRSETFGLATLEAMACDTLVAAIPVEGPLDVVSNFDGGVLHEDLRVAALQALELSHNAARARALRFDWNQVCDGFLSLVEPARQAVGTVRMHPAR